MTEKIIEEVSRIDRASLSNDIREAAKKKALDKFDENLDDVLEKFNDKLDSVNHIYNSIADTVSGKRKNGNEIRFSID